MIEGDSIFDDLQQLMKKNYTIILKAHLLFITIAETCSNSQTELVITHGDAPGNRLVNLLTMFTLEIGMIFYLVQQKEMYGL